MAPVLTPPEEAERIRHEDFDYAAAEGLRDRDWRAWMMVGVGLTSLLAILALIVALVKLGQTSNDNTPAASMNAPAAAGGHAMAADTTGSAPTLADAKGMKFEKFQPVDPTLPAVPPGAVKHFTVGVDQHVVQVDPALAPVQAWTYTVNGKVYKGTAASPPIVVNEGDQVSIKFVNGANKAMHVNMAHSIDFHSAEVAPSKYYVDIAPGKSETINFVAKHPGVFMYHCATQPILMHTGAGMTGMMVVKPRKLAPVDKEVWLVQNEFYIGQPGGLTDMAKVNAEKPDVMAFNGYANQYKLNPITVRKGERIRAYVLDAGPSKWSAFHVIGTVFDTTHIEGVVGHDSQTVNLAPSQGGWVEFTLDQEGNYPFVTHSFGDMAKGAAGMFHTTGAPMPKAPAATAPAPAAKGGIAVTLGDMWIKSPVSSAKAGKVSFQVRNSGATMHQFAIVRAPAQLNAGVPSGALAKSPQLMGGKSATVSATLKPGSYELVCIMPGHYQAGQHIPFTVSG
ncbi:MAG TPA: multicopper oxidase domain-containing protein [Thermoleophilaceae bacterium]